MQGRFVYIIVGMFYKKYLVINSMNSLGSLGLVYLLCNGSTTRVKLAANTMKAPKGDLWAALLLDKRLFVKELTSKNVEFELDCPTLNRAECLIAVKSTRLEALAYASDGASDSGALFAMLKNALEQKSAVETEKQVIAEAEDAEAEAEEPYESFVERAGNYFEGESFEVDEISRNKSIEEYSEAFRRYYEQENGGSYYLSVKEQLQNLFDNFPAAPELIDRFENSYWIKISRKNKHFALGLLTDDGAPSFICYALPAPDGKSADEDFELTTLENGEKYYVLYQDTTDGKVKRGRAVS